MDKTAIEQIQLTQVATVLNDRLQTMGPTLIAPSSFEIHDLEALAPCRNRFRGTMRTASVADFISYLSDHDDDNQSSDTFIDGECMSANCIHNIGDRHDPGHCDHKTMLNLEKTAAYKAVLDIKSRRAEQITLSNFLEDWDQIISCANSNGEKLQNSIVVNAVRTITIATAREINNTIGDFENSASAIEKVEARNANNLPAYIHVTLKPYADLQERTISLRCSLLTGGSEPVFSLRIIKEEELDEELVNEFKNLIQEKVKPLNTNVYIGRFKR